ncbi:hypothetical protein [Paenibacillus sp. sgz500958]
MKSTTSHKHRLHASGHTALDPAEVRRGLGDEFSVAVKHFIRTDPID